MFVGGQPWLNFQNPQGSTPWKQAAKKEKAGEIAGLLVRWNFYSSDDLQLGAGFGRNFSAFDDLGCFSRLNQVKIPPATLAGLNMVPVHQLHGHPERDLHVASRTNIVPDGRHAFFAAVTQMVVVGENGGGNFRAQFGGPINVGNDGFIEFERLEFQEIIN
jgi:hypothetical protein